MTELTESQKATNWETLKHIELVMQYLETMKHELARRQFSHDRSKLESPEMEMFEKVREPYPIKTITYGSDKYDEGKRTILKEALHHHYENNRHHCEFFPNGIEDMNLIDVLEMLCDWGAACQRHADGNIYRSLEINTERFNLSPQLVQILKNTIPILTSVYGANTQKHLHES